jgi:hypothetical protein
MKVLIASAAALILSAPAFAAHNPPPPSTYRFTIIGDGGYYFYYSFDLPVTPTNGANKNIYQFELKNITVNTVNTSFQADAWFFLATTNGIGTGGLELDTTDESDVYLSTDGPSLFSWSGTTPTFKQGTFSLVDYDDGSGTYPIESYTITIGLAANAPPPPPPPPPTVPEPASWALMLVGFGAIGGTLRARRRSVRFG